MQKLLLELYKGLGMAAIVLFGAMSGINLLQGWFGSAVLNFGIAMLYFGLYFLILRLGWK